MSHGSVIAASYIIFGGRALLTGRVAIAGFDGAPPGPGAAQTGQGSHSPVQESGIDDPETGKKLFGPRERRIGCGSAILTEVPVWPDREMQVTRPGPVRQIRGGPYSSSSLFKFIIQVRHSSSS
jgi:hypothetical protein